MSTPSPARRFRLSFNAPVTLGFAGICLLALMLNYITRGASNRALFSVYRAPLTNPLTYLRMVGHIFGHMDIDHFMGNMMYILLLGPMLEEKYGSRDLALVILITGLVTGIFYFIFRPDTMLLGASGVVFAFILLASITRTRAGEIPLTFVLVALLYIGQQIYQALAAHDNVAYLGHILGGAVGAMIGLALNRQQS